MESTREKNKIILEFDSAEDAEKVQRAIDAQRYLQIVKKSKATEKDVQNLANQINQEYWDQNKHKYLKST
jgi:tRNA threonylcarbamoyladenosine modification (KEOPS) complex  Pcc1 subunit